MNRFNEVVNWNISFIQANIIFNYSDVKVGDLDGDGQVTSIDANLLKRIVAGMITAEELGINVLAADVNGDGYVNSVDTNIIKRVLAGSYVL